MTLLLDPSVGLGDGCTLSADDQRLISQIQGRTYAGIFGVAERFVNAKIVEMQAAHVFDGQTALEALVRFSDEELKHQELFRRVEALCEQAMPKGYVFAADPNDVARAVMSKSTWAVLALTLHIELFTQSHYRESIDGDAMLSPLYKDVFKYHWREECQHAMLDELEFRRVDARPATRTATSSSRNSLNWWGLSTAFSRRRQKPTQPISPRSAAACSGPMQQVRHPR